jgi:hypothetical protein
LLGSARVRLVVAIVTMLMLALPTTSCDHCDLPCEGGCCAWVCPPSADEDGGPCADDSAECNYFEHTVRCVNHHWLCIDCPGHVDMSLPEHYDGG